MCITLSVSSIVVEKFWPTVLFLGPGFMLAFLHSLDRGSMKAWREERAKCCRSDSNPGHTPAVWHVVAYSPTDLAHSSLKRCFTSLWCVGTLLITALSQVLVQYFNQIAVWTLAGPLQHLHSFLFHPFC